MPRRKKPRSRGQIQSRGHDRWLVRVYLGTDPGTGKRTYSSKTVTGSKREAEKVLTEMLHGADSGSFIEPSKTTLKDYLEGYLRGRKDIAEWTVRNYETRMRNDVYPYIGHVRMDQLNPMLLSNLYNVTLHVDRGLKSATIAATHKVLTQALTQAVDWKIITSNPVDKLKLPRDTKVDDEGRVGGGDKIKVMTPEQVRFFLESTSGSRYGALWTLMLSTGLRPQEALALKWEDIEEPVIYIRRALRKVRGGFSVGPGKTSNSRRNLALPEGALRALRAHRVQQARDSISEWIFSTQDGRTYLKPDYVSRVWRETMEGLGWSFRLYDTRHTHATLLLMMGENPKVVSERLGHATTSFTMDVYTSVLPSMQQQAAAKLEGAFFGPQAVSL